MVRHYAAITDRAYLAKFLALHDSLLKQSSEDFLLHVLALDNETHRILDELSLPKPHMPDLKLQVCALSMVESKMELAALKRTRTHQEYCWTLASQFMEFLLPMLKDVTYIDSDCYFFADPKIVFDEIGNRSIAITPHRFPPERKYMEVNGVFNVGWVTIRHTAIGAACIGRWAAQVRDRCSAKEGCGDQVYLDEWPLLYGSDLCIIDNPGVNLAPWNVSQYGIYWNAQEPTGLLVSYAFEDLQIAQKVVFYHFHEYKDEDQLTFYALRDEDKELIYAPYITILRQMNNAIGMMEAAFELRRQSMENEWERA